MRTIKELFSLGRTVFIYFSSSDICRQFLKDAEQEGFTLSDGRKPTEKEYPDCIYAIHVDMTVNGVGFAGHAALQADDSNSKGVIRTVDYEKYITDEENYFYKRKRT